MTEDRFSRHGYSISNGRVVTYVKYVFPSQTYQQLRWCSSDIILLLCINPLWPR